MKQYMLPSGRIVEFDDSFSQEEVLAQMPMLFPDEFAGPSGGPDGGTDLEGSVMAWVPAGAVSPTPGLTLPTSAPLSRLSDMMLGPGPEPQGMTIQDLMAQQEQAKQLLDSGPTRAMQQPDMAFGFIPSARQPQATPQETIDGGFAENLAYGFTETGDALRAARGGGTRAVGGGLAWAGDLLGLEGVQEYGTAMAAGGQEQYNQFAQQDYKLKWSSFLHPEEYNQMANEILQESGPTIVMAAASGPISLPLRAVLGPAGRGVIGWGIKKYGIKATTPLSKLIRVGGKAIAGDAPIALAMTGVEGGMEAGGTYLEALQKGFSSEDAVRIGNKTFAANMPLAFLNMAEVSLLTAPIRKNAGAKALLAKLPGAIIKRMPVGLLTLLGNAIAEGEEENYQDMVAQWALGEGLDLSKMVDFQSDGFMLGFTNSLIPGMAAVSAERVFGSNADKLSPEQQEQLIEDWRLSEAASRFEAAREASAPGAEPGAATEAPVWQQQAATETPKGRTGPQEGSFDVRGLSDLAEDEVIKKVPEDHPAWTMDFDDLEVLAEQDYLSDNENSTLVQVYRVRKGEERGQKAQIDEKKEKFIPRRFIEEILGIKNETPIKNEKGALRLLGSQKTVEGLDQAMANLARMEWDTDKVLKAYQTARQTLEDIEDEKVFRQERIRQERVPATQKTAAPEDPLAAIRATTDKKQLFRILTAVRDAGTLSAEITQAATEKLTELTGKTVKVQKVQDKELVSREEEETDEDYVEGAPSDNAVAERLRERERAEEAAIDEELGDLGEAEAELAAIEEREAGLVGPNIIQKEAAAPVGRREQPREQPSESVQAATESEEAAVSASEQQGAVAPAAATAAPVAGRGRPAKAKFDTRQARQLPLGFPAKKRPKRLYPSGEQIETPRTTVNVSGGNFQGIRQTLADRGTTEPTDDQVAGVIDAVMSTVPDRTNITRVQEAFASQGYSVTREETREILSNRGKPLPERKPQSRRREELQRQMESGPAEEFDVGETEEAEETAEAAEAAPNFDEIQDADLVLKMEKRRNRRPTKEEVRHALEAKGRKDVDVDALLDYVYGGTFEEEREGEPVADVTGKRDTRTPADTMKFGKPTVVEEREIMAELRAEERKQQEERRRADDERRRAEEAVAKRDEKVEWERCPLRKSVIDKVFKWADEVIPTSWGVIVKRDGMEDIAVEVVDLIDIVDEQAAKAWGYTKEDLELLKKQGIGPRGAVTRDARGRIKILVAANPGNQKFAANKMTIDHEIFHVAVKYGLSPAEVLVVFGRQWPKVLKDTGVNADLEDVFTKPDQTFKSKSGRVYSGHDLLDRVEELAANAYGAWSPGNAGIFARVNNWLKGTRDAVTPEGVHEKIRETGVRKEAGANTREGVRFQPPPRSAGDQRFKGLPDSVVGSRGYRALRARLIEIARRGEPGKEWYGESATAIIAAAGGNLDHALKLAQVLAIYSPQKPVLANADAALRAWAKWKSGMTREEFLAENIGMQRQDVAAADVLYNPETKVTGRKRGSFFTNLYDIIGGLDDRSVTVDLWIARLMGFDRDSVTWRQYESSEELIQEVADQLGWKPYQAQAALWVWAKSLWESMEGDFQAEAKKRGIPTSIEVESDGEMVKIANPEYRKMQGEMFQKEIRRELKRGQPTVELSADSMTNFKTAFEDQAFILSHEYMPGDTTGVLTGFQGEDATAADRMEYTADMADALTIEGRDGIASILGVDPVAFPADFYTGTSVWINSKGEIENNPATQIPMPGPLMKGGAAERTVHQKASAQARLYSFFRAKLTSQTAFAGYRIIKSTSFPKKDRNTAIIKTREPLTAEQMATLSQRIQDLSKTAGLDNTIIAVYPTRRGVVLVNTIDPLITDEEDFPERTMRNYVAKKSVYDFNDLVAELLKTLPGFEGAQADFEFAHTFYYTVDDYAKKYLKRDISQVSSPATVQRLEDELVPRVSKVYRKWQERGLGEAPAWVKGQIDTNLRPDLASEPKYTHFWHFSTSDAIQQEGILRSFAGTGAVGKERDRWVRLEDGSIDPDSQVIHFYLPGAKPEPQVVSKASYLSKIVTALKLIDVESAEATEMLQQISEERKIYGNELIDAWLQELKMLGYDGIVQNSKGQGQLFRDVKPEEIVSTEFLDRMERAKYLSKYERKALYDLTIDDANIPGTHAFRRWFRKSAAQRDGRPIELLHGTARPGFGHFDLQYTKGRSCYGPGFYFTEEPDVADGYARVGLEGVNAERRELGEPELLAGAIYKVYLSIQDPFDFNATFDKRAAMRIQRGLEQTGIDTKQAAKVMSLVGKQQGDVYNWIKDTFPERWSGNNYTSYPTEALMASGYDGIKSLDTKDTITHTLWVAFSPDQIKSVWNAGSWGPGSRLSYQLDSSFVDRRNKQMDDETAQNVNDILWDYIHFLFSRGRVLPEWLLETAPKPEELQRSRPLAQHIPTVDEFKGTREEYIEKYGEPEKVRIPIGVGEIEDYTPEEGGLKFAEIEIAKPRRFYYDMTGLDGPAELLNSWHSGKDWRHHLATVEAHKLQRRIAKAVGGRALFGLGWYYYGQEAMDTDLAIGVWIDLQEDPTAVDRNWDKLTDYQKKIVDIARNKVANDPELLDIAREISESYFYIGEEAKDAGIFSELIENYVARYWSLNRRGISTTVDSKRTLATFTSHQKQRKLTTILDGWGAGLDLKITGATNSLNNYKEILSTVIESRNLIKAGLKTKVALEDTEATIFTVFPPTGGNYVKINSPSFAYYVPIQTLRTPDEIKMYTKMENGVPVPRQRGKNVKLIDKYGVVRKGNKRARKVFEKKSDAEAWIKTEGSGEYEVEHRIEIWEKRDVYAHPEIGNKLNKILKPFNWEEHKKLRPFYVANAVIKQTILITNLFHHQAFLRSALLGGGLHGVTVEGEKFSKFRLIKTYREGMRLVLNPDSNQMMRLLVQEGLTFGRVQEWDELMTTDWERNNAIALQTASGMGKAARATAGKVMELRRRMTVWLFANFGSALKAQTAMVKMLDLMDHNPTMDPRRAARLVARLMNEDFGGLHWERMGVSRDTQVALRLTLLAPDWTGSNFLTIARIFKPGMLKDAPEIKTAEEKSLLRKTYLKFWAGVILKGYAATFALNMIIMALSKATDPDDDDSYLDRLKRAWRQGWRRFVWADVDVTPLYKMFGGKEDNPRYFSVLGHFKDPFRWAVDPLGSLKAKGSALTRIIYEGLSGSDWKGDGFTTVSELLGVDEAGVYESSGSGHRKGDPKGGQNKWQTTARGKKGKTVGFATMPSFLIHEVMSSLPIQIQNALGWMTGEIHGFEAMGRASGIDIKRGANTDYDLIAEDVQKVSDKFSVMKKTDPAGAAKYLQKNRKLLSLKKSADAVDTKVKRLKTQVLTIEKSGLPDDKKEAAIQKLEDQIRKLQHGLVEQHKMIMEGQ